MRNISPDARKRMGGSTKFKPKHGMCGTPEYRTWGDMCGRCNNPNVESYPRYGGRGIKVSKRWQNFENFYADMGKRPFGYSLERRNVNANYSPKNCYWRPLAEQQQNKTNTVWVYYRGSRMCAAEAARRMGVKPDTLRKQLRRGGGYDKCLSQ